MPVLTRRQEEIFNFILNFQKIGNGIPSLWEIANHFKFRSVNAAKDHVRALQNKGYLEAQPGKARSLKVISPHVETRKPVVDIPIYGAIAAGLPQDEKQTSEGCISIDVDTLGIRNTNRTFALQVKGDSMIGKCIMEGDYVILEHGITPKTGDVVAALIDNENTLKTFFIQKGKPFLKAENPKYPKLLPAFELVIQGVMVALIRRRK
jgi:repressor LexA